MRVVGGRLRSRPIAGPKSSAIRPTADRLRESLFNILIHGYGDPVTGARVLDLFAGTGALGIEALSRGAAYVLFVDDGAEARALMRENIADAWASPASPASSAATPPSSAPCYPVEPFTLAFLDPPYGKGLAEQALASAREGGWLLPGAIVVVEEAVAAVQSAGRLRRAGAARLRRHRVRHSLNAGRTAARCRPASIRHKSGGRDCTGRNSAPLPSRAAARSFPRA